MQLHRLHPVQLAQVASLNVVKAYQNSPILLSHNKYHCMFWKGSIYVKHVAIEGLATDGGIQGNIVHATLALLKFHKVEPMVK